MNPHPSFPNPPFSLVEQFSFSLVEPLLQANLLLSSKTFLSCKDEKASRILQHESFPSMKYNSSKYLSSLHQTLHFASVCLIVLQWFAYVCDYVFSIQYITVQRLFDILCHDVLLFIKCCSFLGLPSQGGSESLGVNPGALELRGTNSTCSCQFRSHAQSASVKRKCTRHQPSATRTTVLKASINLRVNTKQQDCGDIHSKHVWLYDACKVLNDAMTRAMNNGPCNNYSDAQKPARND